MIRPAIAMLAACLIAAGPARAQFPNNTVKVGVLTDLSGPFSDQVGKGSVTAAQMAAEDFMAEQKDLKAEIISADHQNKPDIGVNIARQWADQEGVAAIVDLPNSGVALAVANVLKEKNRVLLASSTATSSFTGKACTPIGVQWVLDTWALGHSTVDAIMSPAANTWFFLTVDYALGLSLEGDASEAVKAAGGKVLGAIRSPLGTADFSSPLLEAQASGAKVIALANTGTDVSNAVKQAAEFGVIRKGVQVAALFVQLSDIHALGLQVAQGLQLTAAFYWDLNDDTRAFSKRFGERMGGRMPTEDQAGVYASTLHYLRSVHAHPTMDGAAAVAAMRTTPLQDKLFQSTEIRIDGRVIHPMYVFRVKTPEESKGPYDYYTLVHKVPAERAFRPLADGGCPLVK